MHAGALGPTIVKGSADRQIGQAARLSSRNHRIDGGLTLGAASEGTMSIATKVKKAARKIEKAVTGEEPQVDILDTLKEEHEMVSALLERLVDSGKPGERKSLVRQIKAALMPHIKAEQKVLYNALLAVRDKKAKQDGAEGYIEHALAERTLNDLGRLRSPLSPEFSATAKVLKELIAHHVREEESDLWSDAREHFESEERKAMNRLYLSEKKKVRIS